MSAKKILSGVLLFNLAYPATGETAAVGDELWLDELEMATPVTITNMKQNPRDVPASITVITRDDIERRGYLDIYDLLRSVPGLTGSTLFSAIEHGGVYIGQGMDMQVNGVSQTLPTHSTSILEFLVPMDALERVEIVRGSNAAADGGSKSFKGTINFISRKPEFGDQPYVKVQSDTDGKTHGYAYYNPANKSHHFSISGNYFNDNEGLGGYEPVNTTAAAPITAVQDQAQSQSVYLQYDNEISAQQRLRIDSWLMSGDFQFPGMSFSDDAVADSSIGQMDYLTLATHYTHITPTNNEISASFIHQDWQWQQDWNVCGPRGLLSQEASDFANAHNDQTQDLFTGNFSAVTPSPELSRLLVKLSEPGQLNAICGFRPLSTDIAQTTLKLQSTLAVRPDLQWVAGIDGNRISINRESLDNTIQYEKFRAFTNAQWSYEHAVINLGAANEHYNNQNSLSSRFGLNYHLDNTKTLRYIASKGEKTPDVADLDSELSELLLIVPEVVNGSTQHILFNGDALQKNTDPQTVYNQEIGLFWIPERKHNIDFRIFNDRYRNANSYDLYLGITPTPGDIEKRGSEIQYAATSGAYHYGLSLFYHDSESTTQAEENYLTAGTFVYFNTQIFNNYNLALNAYFNKHQISWVEEISNLKSKTMEIQLGRKITRDIDITLTYRYESAPHISRLYYPDYYINDYDNLNSLMLGARAAF